MPRQNVSRTVYRERSVAQRVAYERDKRGMSVESLAKRMEEVGCPIQVSALYRLEKAEPPRRITVDELVAFSEVFGIGVEELMLPIEVVEDREIKLRLLELDDILRQLIRGIEATYNWSADIVGLIQADHLTHLIEPMVRQVVVDILEGDGQAWARMEAGTLLLKAITDIRDVKAGQPALGKPTQSRSGKAKQ